MKSTYFAAFICLIIFADEQSIHAHVDRVIELKAGILVGLPDKYSPARYDPKIAKLTVGKNSIYLDKFGRVIPRLDYERIFHGSWYHKGDVLPPYLCINLKAKKHKLEYAILLNLDTLELIYINLEIHIKKNQTISHELKVPVELMPVPVRLKKSRAK